jgi:hypothetical protein
MFLEFRKYALSVYLVIMRYSWISGEIIFFLYLVVRIQHMIMLLRNKRRLRSTAIKQIIRKKPVRIWCCLFQTTVLFCGLCTCDERIKCLEVNKI